MTHTCHAWRCEVPCKPEMLMCLRHWRMVPSKLQRQVYETYRHGQCDDKSPSEAWHQAADAAIAAVALRERCPPGKLTVPMVRALLALAPELLGTQAKSLAKDLKKLDRIRKEKQNEKR